jgi:hypothetical protein
MTYEFAKYPDGTLAVFSDIGKKANGEEYIRITFERPTAYGFDTFVIEFPSYEVILEDGHYSDEEKRTFFEIVKKIGSMQGGKKYAKNKIKR